MEGSNLKGTRGVQKKGTQEKKRSWFLRLLDGSAQIKGALQNE